MNAVVILKAELQNSINHFKLNLQDEKGLWADVRD
ncbi:Hypothetical protein GSB_155168 [Giardia duodenalis]|uniref:Uncharacterized protein n=1 Tax=Giardia intestinalis TaxID=5741 RepID=V6TS79_GIAIN|nr:Hypothetical protein GSB_155168 [Giardia intestinalis]